MDGIRWSLWPGGAMGRSVMLVGEVALSVREVSVADNLIWR